MEIENLKNEILHNLHSLTLICDLEFISQMEDLYQCIIKTEDKTELEELYDDATDWIFDNISSIAKLTSDYKFIRYRNYSDYHKYTMRTLVQIIMIKINKEVPYVKNNKIVFNSLAILLSSCENRLELLKALTLCNHISSSIYSEFFENNDNGNLFSELKKYDLFETNKEYEFETDNHTRFMFDFRHLLYIKTLHHLVTQPFKSYKTSIIKKYANEQSTKYIKDIYTTCPDELKEFKKRLNELIKCDNFNEFYDFHKKEKSHLINNCLAYNETNETVILEVISN